MPQSSGCVSTARSVVIWSSFTLALAGWVGAAAGWIVTGHDAGVDPGFIVALSVAITFTITCSHAVVMPDKVKIYGLGFRDGVQHESGRTHDPEPSRLTVVR